MKRRKIPPLAKPHFMDLYDVNEAQVQMLVKKGVVRTLPSECELIEWRSSDEATAVREMLVTLKRMRMHHARAKRMILS